MSVPLDRTWTPHRRSSDAITLRLCLQPARRSPASVRGSFKNSFPASFPVTSGEDDNGCDFPRDRLGLPIPSPRGLGPGAADRGGLLAVRLRGGDPDSADEEPAQSRWVPAAPVPQQPCPQFTASQIIIWEAVKVLQENFIGMNELMLYSCFIHDQKLELSE